MTRDIVIISGGMISAIGNNIPETLASFDSHKSGIAPARYLQTVHQAEFPLGEVKLNNAELAERAGMDPTLSRTILLGHHAAKEAMASLPLEIFSRYRTGFISATSVGGMDKTEFFAEDFLNNREGGDLRQVVHHDCGKSTDIIASNLGIKGFVSTVSTACSSSANSIMLGARLIRNKRLDIVVAGGVDSLTRFTLNGFNSLMIVDREQCRPLDQSRAGLNLGEGAAYVVLMSAELAQDLRLDPLCRLSGYCNANDAYHQTALSDEGNGPYLAMTGALKMSGLEPSAISYINMHGTGTQNNDIAEGKAVERVFHPNYPKLSSTKSFTGHTLGASGGMEALLSALAVSNGLIYPNFSFSTPIEGLKFVPETVFQRDQNITNVLSNSFGFGGNCTSLIFSKQ